MTTPETKRTRRPSDPIATALAAMKQMNPDQLHAAAEAFATDSPRAAGLFAGSLMLAIHGADAEEKAGA